jgi:hypothetical protein
MYSKYNGKVSTLVLLSFSMRRQWLSNILQVPDGSADLDPSAMIYLLVDTINTKREKIGDRIPCM